LGTSKGRGTRGEKKREANGKREDATGERAQKVKPSGAREKKKKKKKTYPAAQGKTRKTVWEKVASEKKVLWAKKTAKSQGRRTNGMDEHGLTNASRPKKKGAGNGLHQRKKGWKIFGKTKTPHGKKKWSYFENENIFNSAGSGGWGGGGQQGNMKWETPNGETPQASYGRTPQKKP